MTSSYVAVFSLSFFSFETRFSRSSVRSFHPPFLSLFSLPLSPLSFDDMASMATAFGTLPGQAEGPSELLATGEALDNLRKEAKSLPSISLTPRQICDLEMLLNGGFSPLKGFLEEGDYDSVVENLRLKSGALWPMQSLWIFLRRSLKNTKLAIVSVFVMSLETFWLF